VLNHLFTEVLGSSALGDGVQRALGRRHATSPDYGARGLRRRACWMPSVVET